MYDPTTGKKMSAFETVIACLVVLGFAQAILGVLV